MKRTHKLWPTFGSSRTRATKLMWDLRQDEGDEVPTPPDQPADPPVKEPPDTPIVDPAGPVRDPGPRVPQRVLA